MLRRFWHFLFGHRWREHSVRAFAGTNQIRRDITNEDTRMEVYGFTDIDLLCSCGAHKTHRMMGQRDPNVDRDLEQLRRMIEK